LFCFIDELSKLHPVPGMEARRFGGRTHHSGRQRKPHKIAKQLAKEGDRHARTPDESEEGPETLGVRRVFCSFSPAEKEQKTRLGRI
jgi:hypothetical protein